MNEPIMPGNRFVRLGEILHRAVGDPRILGALIVLGAISRGLLYLAGTSYWYDEAFYLIPVYERSYAELLGPLPTQTIIPPVFLWIMKTCYLAAGPGVWAMRFPAIVAALAGLAVLVPTARTLVGTPGCWWAGCLYALSAMGIIHSAEVRFYTIDALATMLLLWAAGIRIRSATEDSRRAGAALLAFAILLPWMSFASVLVMGGVSFALMLDAYPRQNRGRWLHWVAFNTLVLASTFIVWLIQARHMYYPGLIEHWRDSWDGFPRGYAPDVLVGWTWRRMLSLCEYATLGVGTLILPLALLGAVGIWRESKAIFALLLAPIGITYVAALATKYPFADRTVFFLTPCVYCLAAHGMLQVWQWLDGRRAWFGFVAIAVVLVIPFPRMITDGILPRPRFEFRDAYAYLHQHRKPNDLVVAWCRPLYEAHVQYLFPEWPDDSIDEWEVREKAKTWVLDRPIWVVAPSFRVLDELIEPLLARGMSIGERHSFYMVDVVRLDPPATPKE